MCRICRLFFVMFLAYFAQSPIADAYADSLYPSLFFLDVQNVPVDQAITDKLNLNNKSLKSIQTRNYSQIASLQYDALLHVLIKNWPENRIENIQISAKNIKSSQNYPPVSSDLPPPLS